MATSLGDWDHNNVHASAGTVALCSNPSPEQVLQTLAPEAGTLSADGICYPWDWAISTSH